MARQRPCNFAEILLAIKTLLTDRLSVEADQINIAARLDHIPTAGSIAITLRPRGFRSDKDAFVGGGRLSTVHRRILDVHVKVSLPVDHAASDQAWLTAAEGLYAAEASIADALHGEILTDAAADAIVIEPIELIDDTDVRKADAIWGDTLMSFQIAYEPVLTRTRY